MVVGPPRDGTTLALSMDQQHASDRNLTREIEHDAATAVHEAGILDGDGDAIHTVLLDLAAQPRSLCARERSQGTSLLVRHS